MKNKLWLAIVILLLYGGRITAQIPVEVFVGHTRTTVDILFFKYVKNGQGKASRWLFFNRNRAAADYRMTRSSYLPQFGFTEAFSYQWPRLKGIAPVGVMQVFSTGVFPKAGLQYAHVRPGFTVFSWCVTELRERPVLDYFALIRWTPALTRRLHLFTQAETLNVFPTAANAPFSFTQRARLGLQVQAFQFGAGADLNQAGRQTWQRTQNLGGFLRYEF